MSPLVSVNRIQLPAALVARAGGHAFLGTLRRSDPQQTHAPRVRVSGARVSDPVRARPRRVNRRREAFACRGLHRAARPRAICADREATPHRDPAFVRLACDEPSQAGERDFICPRALAQRARLARRSAPPLRSSAPQRVAVGTRIFPGGQFISWPPVTLSATPVMYEEASEARNTTALQTSS